MCRLSIHELNVNCCFSKEVVTILFSKYFPGKLEGSTWVFSTGTEVNKGSMREVRNRNTELLRSFATWIQTLETALGPCQGSWWMPVCASGIFLERKLYRRLEKQKNPKKTKQYRNQPPSPVPSQGTHSPLKKIKPTNSNTLLRDTFLLLSCKK